MQNKILLPEKPVTWDDGLVVLCGGDFGAGISGGARWSPPWVHKHR